jgi:hypothetical protein
MAKWKDDAYRYTRAIAQVRLDHVDKAVLGALADLIFVKDGKGKCTAGYNAIAKSAGVSRSTAIRSIQFLTVMGFISVKRIRKGPKENDPNVYTVHLEAIRSWAETTPGCKYRYEENEEGSATATLGGCQDDTRVVALRHPLVVGVDPVADVALHPASPSSEETLSQKSKEGLPVDSARKESSAAGRRLAELLDRLTDKHATNKVLTEWAERADALLEDYSESRIADVMTWALSDEFWMSRIFSMNNLASAFKRGTVQTQFDQARNRVQIPQKPARRQRRTSDSPSFKATPRDLSGIAKGDL